MNSILTQMLRLNVKQGIPVTQAGKQLWRHYSEKSEKVFTKDVMDKLVKNDKVVVFMKGNPEKPMCGFSNAVVQILRMHGVDYNAHDVLKSEELRQSIKDYTEWPTIPQVFINGEFVGGCDILLQMHQSGDLIEKLQEVGIKSELLKKAESAKGKTESKK